MSVFPEINGKRVYKQYQGKMDLKPDVIVIGSGMAGMSCASALSRYGRKVLILEQHYVPGGFTHMFTRKGFAWDAGTHAIGQMTKNTPSKRMLDWLTDSKVEWVSLGEKYDRIYLGDGDEFYYHNSFKGYSQALIDKFPNEKEQINKYFKLCRSTNAKCQIYFTKNVMPKALRIFGKPIRPIMDILFKKTTQEVLNELGLSQKLQRILTANWGYYGNIPKESSWALHALVVQHFMAGASYPKGGSKVFASTLLESVLKNGGDVYCQARVKEISVKDGKTNGVIMDDGLFIPAKYVISATAAKVSAGKLVPEKYKKSEWAKKILEQKDSPSYIELNMGFNTDITQFGADTKNHWIFSDDNLELKYWDVLNENSRPPILYISFPSVKEPEHATINGEVRHAAECITFVEWEIFEKWQNTQYKNREEAYEKFKADLSQRIINELKLKFPQMMEHLTHFELSTPLSVEHFVKTAHGSIYGLDGTPERFACKELSPHTPINNFYLTGVDTLATGIVGAMTSGLMTASHLDKRVIKQLVAP